MRTGPLAQWAPWLALFAALAGHWVENRVEVGKVTEKLLDIDHRVTRIEQKLDRHDSRWD